MYNFLVLKTGEQPCAYFILWFNIESLFHDGLQGLAIILNYAGSWPAIKTFSVVFLFQCVRFGQAIFNSLPGLGLGWNLIAIINTVG